MWEHIEIKMTKNLNFRSLGTLLINGHRITAIDQMLLKYIPTSVGVYLLSPLYTRSISVELSSVHHTSVPLPDIRVMLCPKK